jgi:UDP-GlcNAc:undecaprenyl-phosphate/decaprenyl-phosphate GlcNAc-1-phosphate transferase
MIAILTVFAALAVAYVASTLTVPPLVRLAVQRRLFDFPDRDRHGHPLPVPRLGGVAVFMGLAVALLLAKLVDGLAYGRAPALTDLTLALAVGSAILFALGLYDDVRGVPPVAKIIAQAAASLVVVSAGFSIDVISFPPNVEFSLGAWSIPVTVIWLVGVSNALNLVDGMDGLAGGVSVIGLLVTSGAAIVLGHNDVVWQAAALVGALLGFLRYNRPPAKIFLGDSGSLVVGFILAVLSVKGATTQGGSLFVLAPIFALSYPLLDTGIAILRRFLRSEPLSRADGRHIHHQLKAVGLSSPRAVLVVLVLSALVGLLGLFATFAPPALTLAVATAGLAILVFVLVYGMRWLQYHEFVEAGMSFTSAVKKSRLVIRDKIIARDVALLVERARDLEELNAILARSAERFRFTKIELCFDCDPVPPLRTLSTPHAPGWRAEYPVAEVPATFPVYGGSIAYLMIASPALDTRFAAGPERVARIVAPSVARWLSRMDPASMDARIVASNRPAAPRVPRHSGQHGDGARERTRIPAS